MSSRKTITQAILHFILVFSSLIAIYPIIWTLVASLKKDSEIFLSAWTLPKSPEFGNYLGAWAKAGLQLSFLNSVIVSASTVVLVIIVFLF